MKKKIGELIFQIIPVMIGVFLGLWVANWSEDRKKETRSDALVETIKNEIQSNKKILEGILSYHEMLRDSSSYYAHNAREASKTRFFKGTRLMRLMNSAYDSGLQTGALNDLRLSEIQQLSLLYTFQEDYNDFCNMLMNSLIDKDFSENESDMKKIARFLSITMTDVVIQEQDLIAKYKETLATLNKL